jgi:erythromycin esterase-like protein
MNSFSPSKNARLVKNAEAYSRSMFQGGVSSWNRRDRHMAETLESLVDHLSRNYGTTKIVVWEHNSHLGDARATEMGERGELNVGQLAPMPRERSRLIAFSTYTGTVTAASEWDGPAERKRVRPALPEIMRRYSMKWVYRSFSFYCRRGAACGTNSRIRGSSVPSA